MNTKNYLSITFTDLIFIYKNETTFKKGLKTFVGEITADNILNAGVNIFVINTIESLNFNKTTHGLCAVGKFNDLIEVKSGMGLSEIGFEPYEI